MVEPLTPNQRRKILGMAPYHSVPVIAEATGLPTQRVRRFLHSRDIEPVPARVTKLPAGVKLARLVAKHESLAEVARIYGVTRQAVHDRLQKTLDG